MSASASVCTSVCRVHQWHLDDVVAAEDSARVASVAVLPDGALQLQGQKEKLTHVRVSIVG